MGIFLATVFLTCLAFGLAIKAGCGAQLVALCFSLMATLVSLIGCATASCGSIVIDQLLSLMWHAWMFLCCVVGGCVV
jgi:hypothetical protein